MNQMYMIIAVVIIWAVAFAVSITIQMMRKKVEAQLVEKIYNEGNCTLLWKCFGN